MHVIKKLIADIRGASAIEYGLIAALIALPAALALDALGDSLGISLHDIKGVVDNAS